MNKGKGWIREQGRYVSGVVKRNVGGWMEEDKGVVCSYWTISISIKSCIV